MKASYGFFFIFKKVAYPCSIIAYKCMIPWMIFLWEKDFKKWCRNTIFAASTWIMQGNCFMSSFYSFSNTLWSIIYYKDDFNILVSVYNEAFAVKKKCNKGVKNKKKLIKWWMLQATWAQIMKMKLIYIFLLFGALFFFCFFVCFFIIKIVLQNISNCDHFYVYYLGKNIYFGIIFVRHKLICHLVNLNIQFQCNRSCWKGIHLYRL